MTGQASSEADSLIDELDAVSLGPLHFFIVLACALGLGFDLAEFAIGAVLSALFSAPPYSVDPTTLSWLLAAIYLGAIAGASVTGWLADRYGRRAMMIVVLLIIIVTSTAAAASPNIVFLAVVRGLSGFALGAYPPLIATYLTDILPASRRGLLVMITVALGAIGPVSLIFLVRWLTPFQPFGIEAWRWAFIVCAAAALICSFMFWNMPESPRWLVSKGRFAEAKQILAKFGSKSSEPQKPTIGAAGKAADAFGMSDRRRFTYRMGYLLAIYFLAPWSTIGFPLLSGAVLVKKGVNVNDSLLYIGVSSFGPIVGAVLAALFIDRVERKTVLIVCAIAMAVLGFAFALADLPIWLMATGLVFNMVIAIFLPILVIYAAELFPTAQRARTTSWSWASRGIGATLVPLALLPLLQSAGTIAMFAAMAVTLVAFAAIVAVFGPVGAAGRPVQ